jgi:hypothetical protein
MRSTSDRIRRTKYMRKWFPLFFGRCFNLDSNLVADNSKRFHEVLNFFAKCI